MDEAEMLSWPDVVRRYEAAPTAEERRALASEIGVSPAALYNQWSLLSTRDGTVAQTRGARATAGLIDPGELGELA